MKFGGPPKEFNAMVAWLNAHADVLAGSRVMIAGWASRPKLPNVLIAIEFSSAEDAKKFYPAFATSFHPLAHSHANAVAHTNSCRHTGATGGCLRCRR